MAKYRHDLPQLGGKLFLTDAGIETTLIFLEQIDLPLFAAFDLLKDEDGTRVLHRYFSRHATIARDNGLGFILESATWRSSPDWGAKLGYSTAELEGLNRKGVAMLMELRDAFETADSPMVVSGCIGPRGDGYDPGKLMSVDEAQDYNGFQARIFAEEGADMITAITINNIPEATGIVRAAQEEGMPVVVSFTVETDGRLPTGESLEEAILSVDAATGRGPVYYMVSCAHPTHFDSVLTGEWITRIRGLRCNASKRSHAELDSAPDLDAGDPVELGGQYRNLLRRMPQLAVLGGCCGTDHRHIEQIGAAVRAA